MHKKAKHYTTFSNDRKIVTPFVVTLKKATERVLLMVKISYVRYAREGVSAALGKI